MTTLPTVAPLFSKTVSFPPVLATEKINWSVVAEVFVVSARMVTGPDAKPDGFGTLKLKLVNVPLVEVTTVLSTDGAVAPFTSVIVTVTFSPTSNPLPDKKIAVPSLPVVGETLVISPTTRIPTMFSVAELDVRRTVFGPKDVCGTVNVVVNSPFASAVLPAVTDAVIRLFATPVRIEINRNDKKIT